jgi:hypothetical protein
MLKKTHLKYILKSPTLMHLPLLIPMGFGLSSTAVQHNQHYISLTSKTKLLPTDTDDNGSIGFRVN